MNQVNSFTEAQQVVFEISRHYLSDYSPSLSLGLTEVLNGYIRSRNLRGLANCVDLFDPQSMKIDDRRHLSQISAFFKKNKIFSEDAPCKAAALVTFNKAEEVCRITNKRLTFYYEHPDRLDPVISKQLGLMERFIHRVLGDYDSFLEALPHRIRVTPGATATRSRRKSLPFMKVTMKPECTPRALPYIEALYSYYGYKKPRPRLSLWNRVEAVPKNWKTHRTIACEPTHNVPLQLAFDDHIKARLRRNGVNLLDQSLNQELARQGSIDGSFATIDLSSASDTLALNVIHLLFPENWARYVLDIRSPFYKMDGVLRKYAKFSSMGNGTTFGLESLIFAACCSAVGAKEWNVYGDDIIVSTEHYSSIARLLKYLGFSLNWTKSFHEGPFRESCGADWFSGQNITPFYLRDWRPITRCRKTAPGKPEMCHNVNGLASVALPDGLLWNWLSRLSAKHQLPLVPYNEASNSGVWIDSITAHSKGLVNYTDGYAKIRAFVSKTRTLSVPDSRSLFLWHLDKVHRDEGSIYGEFHLIEGLVIRSLVPSLSSKYVLKWVTWIRPGEGVLRSGGKYSYPSVPRQTLREPDHLSWWTENLNYTYAGASQQRSS